LDTDKAHCGSSNRVGARGDLYFAKTSEVCLETKSEFEFLEWTLKLISYNKLYLVELAITQFRVLFKIANMNL